MRIEWRWLRPTERDKRNESIREKWQLGWSAKDIAERYDITPQRVHQIVRFK
jgi:Mor family transcriptional regulator